MSEKQFTRVNWKQERIGEIMTVNIEGLGKITASKDVLNIISLAFAHESNYYITKGYEASEEISEQYANDIHNLLAKTGYYDE